MIPATFPSVLDSSNRTKMLVYQVPSITGLTRWVDYIPVKSPASESDLTLANTYANEGFILTSKVNDITGLVPFKDYVPIYLDSTATKAWSADNDGYIPMAELAGLLLDFTTGNLDARINFSRTTNATVTNSAGQITYAPHNLLTFSEQFDNSSWGMTNLTVISNSIVAPNETITADKLVLANGISASSCNMLKFTPTATRGSVALSVYVQAAGRTAFAIQDGSGNGITVNLATVTATTFGLATNASITPSTNGFYRISCITNTPSATQPAFYLAFSGAVGNGLDGLYIWGAQAEINSTATTYNSTTVKNLLGFSELFDNAAWTKSNSFVQTNLLKYSEDFSNASWSGFAAITANTEIAPNGYQTADTLTANAVYQPVTCTASTQYTFSFYAKLGTMLANKYLFAVRDDTAGVFIAQDISPSVTLTTSEWQRVTYTFTTPVGCTIVRPYIYRDSAGGANGTAYIWGAQLVQGSDAGAYRRTDAAALPVYYPNHNGVVCAEKLVEVSGSAEHYIQQSATAGNIPYTYACYIKAGERTKAQVVMSDLASGNATATIDLSTGIVTTATSGSWTSASGQAVPSGNGFYRVSITATKGAGTSIGARTYLYTTAATYTGDGTSGIYIFGAQLSDSASLDPYVLNAAAAPTAAAYYGARFDYDPVTLAPKGLLIEEQRSNLVLQSEDFSSASWTKSNTTISSNSTIAPNGTLTADTITATAINGEVYQAISITAGTQRASSIWIKRKLGIGTISLYAATASTDITSSVTDSWTRISLVSTAGSSIIYSGIKLGTSGDAVDVWGAQLEAGAFATSYIPTAASQVTRAADTATIQGSNFYGFYNQNEGSMVGIADAYTVTPAVNSYIININDGSATGSLVTYVNTTSVAAGYLISYMSGTQATITTPTILANTAFKQASTYKLNDVAGVLNNGTVLTDTNALIPLTTMMQLGNNSALTRALNGHIKQISYYPQRLSNDVLKGLTA